MDELQTTFNEDGMDVLCADDTIIVVTPKEDE